MGPKLACVILCFCSFVASALELKVASRDDRSGATAIEQAVLSGDRFVFVAEDPSISQVRFFVNGKEVQEENKPPWDLAGTAKNSTLDAYPWDTTTLGDGVHQLVAKVRLSNGQQTELAATVTIQNDRTSLVATPAALSLSLQPQSQSRFNLSLSSSDNAAIAVALAENHNWLSLTQTNTTTPSELNLQVDTASLSAGSHSGKLVVSADGYDDLTIPIELTVGGEVNDLVARQLHLAWDQGDDRFTAVWFSDVGGTGSLLEYRPAGTQAWQQAIGEVRHSNDDGDYHQATTDALTPGTEYQFRVQIQPGAFSEIYTTRSAPAVGQPWSLLYVADTGLVGREDGLATGTQAVIDAMVGLDPDLLLLGGDYAYFNTDKRYGTLERSIDAWFDQMAPLATVPMMPAWGNHEIQLGEGFEPWVARFPVPSGYRDGQAYAFDVGDVHFIEVYAFNEDEQMRGSALEWLSDHLDAIKDLNYRWVIPFMHAPPFSDGSNHPSAEKLRAQIGPLFEEHDIRLVLTAHDQSYERTLPLVDVPATNRAVTEDLTCYDQPGTTYMKISPGGKISNRNGSFSDWLNDPAPSWTAVRNNDAHHISQLAFDAQGDIQITTYGINAGQPLRIVDQFTIAQACGPAILTNPVSLSASLEPDQTLSLPLQASLSEGVGVLIASSEQGWISVQPESGSEQFSLNVVVDSTGLEPGQYLGSVEISSNTGLNRSVPVTLNVTTDQYRIYLSDSPDRSLAKGANGQSVAGNIYAFVLPEEELNQVVFSLDGVQIQQENRAPWDLGGTESDRSARPFDTTTLSEGPHQLQAMLRLADNSTLPIEAQLVVDNVVDTNLAQFAPGPLRAQLAAPESQLVLSSNVSANESVAVTLASDVPWLTVAPTATQTPATLSLSIDASALTPGSYQGRIIATTSDGDSELLVDLTLLPKVTATPVWWSAQPDRSMPQLLGSRPLSGSGYVFVEPQGDVTEVRFEVNGSLVQTERKAPWDLGGTAKNTARDALPFDFDALGSGNHQLTITVVFAEGEESQQLNLEVSP
ncbi:metallophosphoesterase [Ferrimonas marina]|uniref:Purple acid Phosphatase, N-terminal domain n=1 Tax=Ferrimonas marina TaxID=299255 RepID=A0A1M5N0S4_9GAMM|nr:metallophosphoesterase [Ferrimonas marina]SHG82593.1 Purple acid Phosphatase, N-terminal domain [Ferrimonas marina]